MSEAAAGRERPDLRPSGPNEQGRQEQSLAARPTGEVDKIIVVADRIMPRPPFRDSTKRDVSIGEGENRRHIVAWQAMHANMKLRLNYKTVREAYQILDEMGRKPKEVTEAAVLDAARQHLIDRHNHTSNLWPGEAAENQRLGREFTREHRRMEKALAVGDRKEFDTALSRLGKLWHDPDPTGSKIGFKDLLEGTIERLRNEFRKKWDSG